LHAPY